MPKGKSNPNPRGRKNGNGAKTKTEKETAGRREPRADERSAAGGNANDLKKIRREVHAELKRIEATRQALNEEASDARERLKNAGIHVKPFMEARRIVMMDDNTARDLHIDELHQSMDDLGIGGQRDWVADLRKLEDQQEADKIERVENALADDQDGDDFQEDPPKSTKPAFLQEPAGNA